jgi:hypothetical protein
MFGAVDKLVIGLLIKPLLVGLLGGILLALAYSLQAGEGTIFERFRRNILPGIGYSLPTVIVAFIAGYLTGISRAPAVGNVIPAVLALIGGLNIYLFGVEARNRALVGYSVFLFSLVFFYGVWGGVLDREGGRVGRFIDLADQERTIRNYRLNRDLPPDPPQWILGGSGDEK